MVHKCANSDCSTPFLYFNNGKLFQFPRLEHHRMEAFWLCGRCAQQLTLQWENGKAVVVTDRPFRSQS